MERCTRAVGGMSLREVEGVEVAVQLQGVWSRDVEGEWSVEVTAAERVSGVGNGWV